MLHQLAMAAHALKQGVERDVAEVGRKVFAIGKQALLLLRDAVQPAVVVDHHHNGQRFLERGLDGQTPRQKGAVAADQHHRRIGVGVFGGHRQRHAHAK